MEIDILLAVAIVICSFAAVIYSSRRYSELDKRVKKLEKKLSGIRDALDG